MVTSVDGINAQFLLDRMDSALSNGMVGASAAMRQVVETYWQIAALRELTRIANALEAQNRFFDDAEADYIKHLLKRAGGEPQ